MGGGRTTPKCQGIVWPHPILHRGSFLENYLNGAKIIVDNKQY